MATVEQLSKIVTVPPGATSFHTENGERIVFLIGAAATVEEVDIDADQFAALMAQGLTGAFGQQID